MGALLIILFLVSFVSGLFLMAKPQAALELQRKFYEKINWNLTPISLAKEIRNTRIMGWILVILSLAILYFAVFQL